MMAFAQSGGRIVAVNGIPEKIVGETVYDAPDFPGMIAYECYEYEQKGERATLLDSYVRAPMGRFTACLKEALKNLPKEIVEMEPCDGIYSAVRKGDTTSYVMIVNDNGSATSARGRIGSDMPFHVIRTENGEEKEFYQDERNFSILLEPYECVVLEIGEEAKEMKGEMESRKQEELIPENIRFRPAESNSALPKMYQVRGKAAEELRKARFAYNPKHVCRLAEALTEKDLVICRGNVPSSMPVKAARDWFGWYPADGQPVTPGEVAVCVYDFVVAEIPETLEFVTDPDPQSVWYLNEEQLFQTGTRRVWHYANPVYNIREMIKPGYNRLVSFSTIPAYNSTSFFLPCALLKGDFRVFEDLVLTTKQGTNKLSYWNNQGYYFYTGDGCYTMDFTAPTEGKVMVELETTDVAEVWLNGQFVGKRLWEPYRFDLKDLLCPGVNHLEIRVTSTLSNFLYNSNPSGVKAVRIFGIS